jgi:uncharacterized protein YjgD (DUF1641 family)
VRRASAVAELSDTLTPVTKQAMQMATDELETSTISHRGTRVAAADPGLEPSADPGVDGPARTHVGAGQTLTSPVSGPAMAKVTEVLATADEKGYFAFAREGSKIADRVVTEFSEEDVQALGDNVVTILNAVKEMTQPEVMGLVQRTAISVQDVEEAHIEPPSMFALLKQMRDPQTRRGLARVMAMLHTVGEEHPSTPTTEGK